jgi:hypothetical protein
MPTDDSFLLREREKAVLIALVCGQVLMDGELRDVYNKFGAEGIKANRRFDEQQMLIEIAVRHLDANVMYLLLIIIIIYQDFNL